MGQIDSVVQVLIALVLAGTYVSFDISSVLNQCYIQP